MSDAPSYDTICSQINCARRSVSGGGGWHRHRGMRITPDHASWQPYSASPLQASCAAGSRDTRTAVLVVGLKEAIPSERRLSAASLTNHASLLCAALAAFRALRHAMLAPHGAGILSVPRRCRRVRRELVPTSRTRTRRKSSGSYASPALGLTPRASEAPHPRAALLRATARARPARAAPRSRCVDVVATRASRAQGLRATC